MIWYNPSNYRGSCDIQWAFQNFEDTHANRNCIWIVILLYNNEMSGKLWILEPQS